MSANANTPRPQAAVIKQQPEAQDPHKRRKKTGEKARRTQKLGTGTEATRKATEGRSDAAPPRAPPLEKGGDEVLADVGRDRKLGNCEQSPAGGVEEKLGNAGARKGNAKVTPPKRATEESQDQAKRFA